MSFRRGLYKEVEDIFAFAELALLDESPELHGLKTHVRRYCQKGPSGGLPFGWDQFVLDKGRRLEKIEVLNALRKEILAALRRGRKAEMALAALSLPLAPVRGVPVVTRR